MKKKWSRQRQLFLLLQLQPQLQTSASTESEIKEAPSEYFSKDELKIEKYTMLLYIKIHEEK